MSVNGKDLIALGFEPGPELKAALQPVNAPGLTGHVLSDWAKTNKPAQRLTLQANPGYSLNLEAESETEQQNVDKVRETMGALMQTPTPSRVGGARI